MNKLFVSALAGISAALVLGGCATGTHIATGNQHPPIPFELVQIYQAPPAHYEIIGMVNASDRGNRQHRMDVAVRKLKKEAAKMGANGVIMNPIETGGLFDRKTKLSGQAIYVLP